MTDLKAYHIYDNNASFDDEANHEIIFAKSSIAAKKIWSCTHWDGLEIAGLNCTHKTKYDQYSPGPVPPTIMIADGWQYECMECSEMINDNYDNPVDQGDLVFCSEDCMDKFDKYNQTVKRHEIRAKSMMRKHLMRKYPDAQPVKDHAYVIKDGPKWIVRQVFIDFKYPGAKYGAASCRIDTLYGEKGHNRRVEWMVPKGDVDVFNSWVDGMVVAND